MTEKFLVEVIYKQPFMRTTEDGEKYYDTKISTQIYSFEGTNRSSTKYDAEKFMDKTIRHGLELKGGSVLKSVIHPSCILQVGLVDEGLYQKELAEGLKDIQVDPSTDSPVSAPISAEAEPPVAVAEVDLDVAS